MNYFQCFLVSKVQKRCVRPQCTGHSQNEALDLAITTLTLGLLYWECPTKILDTYLTLKYSCIGGRSSDILLLK